MKIAANDTALVVTNPQNDRGEPVMTTTHGMLFPAMLVAVHAQRQPRLFELR